MRLFKIAPDARLTFRLTPDGATVLLLGVERMLSRRGIICSMKAADYAQLHFPGYNEGCSVTMPLVTAIALLGGPESWQAGPLFAGMIEGFG